MNIEQKLALFAKKAAAQANTKQEEELNQYIISLKEEFQKRKEQYKSECEDTYNQKIKQLRLTMNHHLAVETLKEKRDAAKQSSTLVTLIFNEVKEELIRYKSSESYMDDLESQIGSVILLADTDIYKIYLDATDSELVPILEKKLNVKLAICKHNLIGGILAKIPGKNLLIDHSMNTMLLEAKENFNFLH